MSPQAHQHAHEQHDTETDLGLDIPFGSLEAAALAEIPYTFSREGTCASYYHEFFG
jgi:hypothetical protein